MTLAHMISLCQYNLYRTAAAEMVSRRLLMIMRAVKTNPTSHDFEGLDMFLSAATDSSGGVVTLDFDKYIADLQKPDAVIQRQNLMLTEKQVAAAKQKGQKPPGGGQAA